MSEREESIPRLRRLFNEARELPPERLGEYLDANCGDDATSKQYLLRLLAVEESESAGLLAEGMDALTHYISSIPNDDIQAEIRQIGAADELDLTSVPLPVIAGYRILEVLGSGGMGMVFRARQAAPLEREVAIKVIKPGMDSNRILARFRLEQRVLARMSHPNIASVLDAGLTQFGHPYFAMELIEGPPIDAYVLANKLPLRAKLDLFLEVCHAVQHAHAQNIVHRDLKPSNILVCDVDGMPTAKVIDFGVAKALDADANNQTRFTQFAELIGTPLYMSPEQVASNAVEIDARSDVYSLGALLYHVLCGSPPIERQQLRALGIDGIRQLICEYHPTRPSLRAPNAGLPDALDWIVLKALEKSPERRYQSVAELSQDVGRIQSGEPVLARPASWGRRLSRQTRKHYRTAMAVLLLVSGVIVGAIGFRAMKSPVQTVQRPDEINQDASGKRDLAEGESARTTDLASDSSSRMEEATELVEAARLTQMLQAFNEGDFARLRDLELPRTDDQQFLGITSSRPDLGKPSPSLRQLLTRIANPIPELTLQHPDAVWDMALSQDRSLLATACKDEYVRLWKIESGEFVTKLGPHALGATAVAFSPDDKTLATGDRDGFVRLFRIADREELAVSGPRVAGIESLVWSPDGNWLVAGVRYDHVPVFDSLGEEQFRIPTGPEQPRYMSLCFERSQISW